MQPSWEMVADSDQDVDSPPVSQFDDIEERLRWAPEGPSHSCSDFTPTSRE